MSTPEVGNTTHSPQYGGKFYFPLLQDPKASQPVTRILETLCQVGLKWPVHDLVLVIPTHPFVKVACNSSPCSKHEGTTLNVGEGVGECYTSEICD